MVRSWIDRMIADTGSPDILAAIMICESPEWFSISEYREAQKLLSKERLELILKFRGTVELSKVEHPLRVKQKRLEPSRFDELIKKHWLSKNLDDISQMTGVGLSTHSIYNRGRQLGLGYKNRIERYHGNNIIPIK